MRPQTVLAMLIRTRNIILRYGWVRLEPGNKQKGFCIGSAMREALMSDDPPGFLTGEDHALLNQTILVVDDGAYRRSGHRNFAFFNDHVLKSKQEALVFLNELIAESRTHPAETAV